MNPRKLCVVILFLMLNVVLFISNGILCKTVNHAAVSVIRRTVAIEKWWWWTKTSPVWYVEVFVGITPFPGTCLPRCWCLIRKRWRSSLRSKWRRVLPTRQQLSRWSLHVGESKHVLLFFYIYTSLIAVNMFSVHCILQITNRKVHAFIFI